MLVSEDKAVGGVFSWVEKEWDIFPQRSNFLEPRINRTNSCMDMQNGHVLLDLQFIEPRLVRGARKIERGKKMSRSLSTHE